MRAIFNSPRRAVRLLDLLVMIAAIFVAVFAAARAQPDGGAITNRAGTPPADSPSPARQAREFEQATEKIRADCLQGRRIICGRIVKMFPEGLVVESGYTGLLRPPLNKSWLVPGTVRATRAADLVEGNEPGCVCVGLVFIAPVPKSRLAKPKLDDYVVIQGYPAGQYTYTSVGSIQRTVRRFSAALATAIQLDRAAAGIQPPVVTPARE